MIPKPFHAGCVVQYRDTELLCVPSAHNHIAFAQCVDQALSEYEIDVVAIELPHDFHQFPELPGMIASTAPGLGVIVIPTGEQQDLQLLTDVVDSNNTRQTQAESALSIPCTPSDSIIMAVSCVVKLWQDPNSPPIELAFVDARFPNFAAANERPSFDGIPDESIIPRIGLTPFYEAVAPHIQAARSSVDLCREQAMAGRLQYFLDQGKSVLFVCGMAHLQSIFYFLDYACTAIAPSATFEPLGSPRALPISAETGWACGWLDEFPYLTWMWYCDWRRQRGHRFDKIAAIEAFRWSSYRKAQRRGLELVPRHILKVEQYLTARLEREGRNAPRLDPDLIHAHLVCADQQLAEFLKTHAMRYPPARNRKAIEIIALGDDRLLLRDGEFQYVIPCSRHVTQTLSSLSGKSPARNRPATLPERKDPPDSVLIPAPVEQKLCGDLLHRVRALAHYDASRPIIQVSNGEWGQGLAVRRTIRARISGRSEVFVRYKRQRANGVKFCDGKCPVIWVFDPVATISNTQSGSFDGLSEKVYSSFYWFSERVRVGEWGVNRSRIAYWTCLLREMPQPYSLETVKALVQSLPAERRCHCAPWRDSRLAGFQGYELALATGILYAADHVILVSEPSLKLSDKVIAFAAGRGITVHRVSSRRIAPKIWHRFSYDHEVPSPRSYQSPFPDALRDVLPMEGFE